VQQPPPPGAKLVYPNGQTEKPDFIPVSDASEATARRCTADLDAGLVVPTTHR
jgi:hypothetical protein